MAHFQHHSSHLCPPQLLAPVYSSHFLWSLFTPTPVFHVSSLWNWCLHLRSNSSSQHPHCLVSDLRTLSDLPRHPNSDLCLINESYPYLKAISHANSPMEFSLCFLRNALEFLSFLVPRPTIHRDLCEWFSWTQTSRFATLCFVLLHLPIHST